MLKYLSQEWHDETRRMAEGQPERPGVSSRLQYVVNEVPGGDAVKYFWVIENGKLTESGLGELEDAEITLTQSYADAVAIQKGELDPSAAFMQGRVKAAGNMSKLMFLLPITSSPEYKALQEEIRRLTEY